MLVCQFHLERHTVGARLLGGGGAHHAQKIDTEQNRCRQHNKIKDHQRRCPDLIIPQHDQHDVCREELHKAIQHDKKVRSLTERHLFSVNVGGFRINDKRDHRHFDDKHGRKFAVFGKNLLVQKKFGGHHADCLNDSDCQNIKNDRADLFPKGIGEQHRHHQNIESPLNQRADSHGVVQIKMLCHGYHGKKRIQKDRGRHFVPPIQKSKMEISHGQHFRYAP